MKQYEALAYAKANYPIGTVVECVYGNDKSIRTINNTDFKLEDDGRILIGTLEKGDCNYSIAICTSKSKQWSRIIKPVVSQISNLYPIW